MLTSGSTTVNEGSTVVFTLNTTNVDAGSVYSYVLTGVDAADVVGGALTGTTTVGADGKAVVAIQLAADATTEGVENMTMTLAGQTASVSVDDTSTTPVPPVPVLNAVLTPGVDGVNGGTDFTGDTGNDTFTAAAGAWSAFDVIDGVSGNDTFTIAETGAIAGTPAQARVLNIDTINITSTAAGAGAVTLDTTTDANNYTGLSALNVTTSAANATQILTTGAGVNVTAIGQNAISVLGGNSVIASTAAGNLSLAGAVGELTVAHSAQGADDISINGGSSVNVTSAVVIAGGTISIGNDAGPTGAVVVNTTTSAVDGTVQGAISVTGGTTVNINQNAANAVNTTTTGGDVTVTGGVATTSVTVTDFRAAAAAADVIGRVNGTVTIVDANAASATDAGTISSVSLTNFGNSSVDSSALTFVSLSGTGGTFDIERGNLDATPTSNTLSLNTLSLIGGAITDLESANDDGFTTINLVNTGTTVIADLVAADLTTLNISGSGDLSFTANTLGGATTTAINSTSTGSVTFDGALNVATAYTGGEGVDTITVGATASAINTGGGDDVVTMSVAVADGGSVDGGTGTNTLVMTADDAQIVSGNATFEAGISNFTRLSIDNSNGAIDLANLDDINYITVTGAVATNIFSNASTGATLVLTDNLGNNDISLANDSNADVLNLVLTNQDTTIYGIVTALEFETLNITATESGSVDPDPTIIDTATVLLNNINATTITVDGNANLDLIHANAALTSLDASAKIRGSVSYSTGQLTNASTLVGGNGNDFINASIAIATVNLSGGDGNDILTGSATRSSTIDGGAGNDTLTGGAAADNIIGGEGTDTFVFSSDIVADQAGTGNTTGVVINLSDAAITFSDLFTTTNAFLPSTVALVAANTVSYLFDNESATNASVVDTLSSIENATGSNGDDYIVGSSGDNVITGGEGADTLTGGAGADTFNHNLATDSGDTITDFTAGTDNFILTTTGLVDNAGTVVAANAIVAGSFATIDGTAAGSASLAAGDVIIELDQATLGVALDFSASTAAQIVTAVEALFAGNNWDTGNVAAAYVESANSEDLLFIVYEAAAQGATADAVLIRATGDGIADSFDGEFTVEAVLTGVAADALTSADFT